MRTLPRLAAPLTLSLLAGLVTAAPASAAPAERRAETQVTTTSFDTGPELRAGRHVATRVVRGSVRLKSPARSRSLAGRRYDMGVFTSPWVTEPHAFTELIPSWQATTPGDSFVEVKVRLRSTTGASGSWDTVARWASGDAHLERTSLGSQEDDLARVSTDTVKVLDPAGASAWQVKVHVMRRQGSRLKPSLDRVGAVASRVEARSTTSRPGTGVGTVLDVPAYSQMTHRGHSPQWGNGGEAWCSPTSTAMVLEYYGANPAAAHAFGGPGHVDGVVDWTARHTYDHGYRGTGNWAFNTAYAGTLVRRAYVTRLSDLRAAEAHLAAGTPLIVSVAFGRGQLSGAPISATAGHLMVLVGFTASGDPVVNDPAAPSNATVRRTYDRAQFESAWLGGSGGVTYVLED